MVKVSHLLAVASMCAGLFVLCGCTFNGTPGTPSSTEAPLANGSALSIEIEPVMVTAGADVDGTTVSVSGYVAGVIEDGGKCDFVLSQETAALTLSNTGNADRSVTSCGLVSGSLSEFRKGSWSVTLNYTANSGVSYKSEPLAMEIP